MKTFFLLSMSAVILFLASCQSMHNNKVSEDFDKGTRNYIRMVRWNELDQTPLSFVEDSLRAEFEKRVKAAKDVQIADYRVKNIECKPDKGVGELTVEWDYYIPPSITLKTVEDPQKWRYVEEENRKGWMLLTLFPEFK
jgi:hypothetical protein